ncbi:MAG: hypothetical protein AMXMBFR13_39290 [Phycisphaerae bacterium]
MNDAHRFALLKLARETIRTHLAGEPLPALPVLEGLPDTCGGVFVTLRRGRQLRGCIGEFQSTHTLADAVQQMALAVLRDPRFQDEPVRLEELTELSVEISVLSPMERSHNPLALVPGIHGIWIRKGGRSGCFLPQVAAEQGWDAVQLLTYCCTHKAGLPPNAWQDPSMEVYLFTAEILEERPSPPEHTECG